MFGLFGALGFLRRLYGFSLSSIRRAIRKHGQFIAYVYGDDDAISFAYTVGNHEHGLPELLISAIDLEGASVILNALGALQRERRRAFEVGELVGLGGKYPLRMDAVDAGLGPEYARVARYYYRTDAVELREVIKPDLRGRWPEDPDCDDDFRLQSIRSPRRSP
jgi:hypothetical protein